MRAQDHYRVEVETTDGHGTGLAMGANDIAMTIAGGAGGYLLAKKLRKKWIAAREAEGLTFDGAWVRIRDRVGVIMFEQPASSSQSAMLLYDKIARDLLDMDVEQFQQTYGFIDALEGAPSADTPAADPWDGVTWSGGDRWSGAHEGE